MSVEATLLAQKEVESPQAPASSSVPTNLTAVMPGEREPCVGQESSANQTSVQTNSPPNHVPQQVPSRVQQKPDGTSTGAEFGTRPPPQGAPDQDKDQSNVRSNPNNAIAAVVRSSATAAAVGLVRPAASNGGEVSQTGSTEQKQSNSKTPMTRSVSFTPVTNGHSEESGKTDQKEMPDEFDCKVEMRKHSRGHLRHAHSEAETSDFNSARRRSQSMAEIKEHAYNRLQEELSKAQTDLRLKDEEVEKLSKVRDQMEEELDDLTASLFEEANKMVQEANIKRMHTEKLLAEANQKIEVLQAEVVALKQLVLTSTPSSPNKHLHPQIAEAKEKKPSKPFWKTHRRSTSHHEFTKESRQAAEAQQAQQPVHCKDLDTSCYNQFLGWRQNPVLDRTCPFLARMLLEDITPCLNFSNKRLSERVQHCVEENTLTIEPIPGDNSYPRKCSLTESNKLCNYKIKLGEDSEWYSISQMCRNRIATVCDFYTYVRYVQKGLVKTEDKDVYLEIIRLRRQMALARLGLL